MKMVSHRWQVFNMLMKKGWYLFTLCFPFSQYSTSIICVVQCRFNWGLSVRNMSERIIKLLEDRSYLKEERDRTRKVTVEIKGFGSFCKRPTISERCNTDCQYKQRLGSALNDPISDDKTWDHHPFCDRDNNHSQASLLSTSG